MVQTSINRTAYTELIARAQREIDEGRLPSCQLALARHGELIASETLGDATPDTRYVVFSATKGEYTIVIVTHDVPQARRVSDHLAFLYRGGLMEFGEPEKLFENPEREETRAYLEGRLLAV